MNNPLVDPYIVLSKVYSGGKYFKQALAESAVEPLNKGRTVAICYGVLERDVYLNYIISANASKTPKAAVRLVLKIALYVLECLGWHDYAVVDSAVELTKKLGKGGAAGFVNAFLRSYKLPGLPAQADERLSVEASVPLWLAKKVRRSYKEEAQSVLCTPSRGVCVRFERRAEEYLARRSGDESPLSTPFRDVYIFKNFVRDDGFFAGDYTFQSIGSVAICHAICGGERLLDMCAAPGGKSVLLSKKFKSVTACELHPHRTVDAPCSGTGVINENPDIKLNRREEDIPSLMAAQAALLDTAARYVAEGGRLYYSTCSVLPEENDTAVHNFLQAHPGFSLQIPSSPLGHRATRYGLQFLPHISLGAGFFISSFCKKS